MTVNIRPALPATVRSKSTPTVAPRSRRSAMVLPGRLTTPAATAARSALASISPGTKISSTPAARGTCFVVAIRSSMRAAKASGPMKAATSSAMTRCPQPLRWSGT